MHVLALGARARSAAISSKLTRPHVPPWCRRYWLGHHDHRCRADRTPSAAGRPLPAGTHATPESGSEKVSRTTSPGPRAVLEGATGLADGCERKLLHAAGTERVPSGVVPRRSSAPTLPLRARRRHAQSISPPDRGRARILAVHGVVRWRASVLIMRLHEEFGLSVSDDTVYRALKEPGLPDRPKAYWHLEQCPLWRMGNRLGILPGTAPRSLTKWVKHGPIAREC